jgi:CBS domain containing-hemolysin-like protein
VLLARGYSRVPVTGKNIDDIVGVLYLKDTARALYEQRLDFATTLTSELVRPPVFVPESMPVEALLQQLQNTNRHIAIVVDEYGGVAGLVTLEDVIEELVGEISDEYDQSGAEVERLEDGSLRVNARYGLADLGEHFEIELDDEDVDSVGGLLAKELGRLPARGDMVTYSGLQFTADRIEGRRKRLTSVLVRRNDDLDDAQAAFGSDD